MASAKTGASNNTRVTQVKDIVRSLVQQYFQATLGREPDIVNIVAALVMRESSFNVNLPGVPSRNSGARAFYSSSAIAAKLKGPITGTERINIEKGVRGIGLMQSMGWNHIRGGAPSGICEIKRLRPELAEPLLVDPGEDLFPVLLGESNMSKALLSGLIILEGKWKSVKYNNGAYSIPGDPRRSRTFISPIQGAITAYLGLGAADDNGTTPAQYAKDILYGAFYVQANGKGSIYVRDTDLTIASSNGPPTNGSSMKPIPTKGCG